jgi:putative DNA primase/helicase
MNAGNLPAVALALHEKYPQVKILICADADPVGMAKAEQAADLVGGLVIAPDFGEVSCEQSTL